MTFREVGKRDLIARAEARMDYFLNQMKARPQLTGIWTYWFHWYRVRRADWQTRLWLEELRDWKGELRRYEKAGTMAEHLDRTEGIRRNTEAVQDGMRWIRTELTETRHLASARRWHIRFPRPHATMIRWLGSVSRRYRTLRYWINRIKEELPAAWKSFVYVIYYAYTSPGAERHLEAHLEGECKRDKKVQEIVKRLANKLLRLWVATPTTNEKGVKPGYAVPMLQSEMAKPPYEGRKIQDQAMWEWGVQWEAAVNYNVSDKRIIKAEPKTEAKKTTMLRFELFDYDYAQLRKYNEYEVSATWWELPEPELLKLVGLEEK